MKARLLWMALFGACLPLAVNAHGFAQRYDLPVPLGLYIGGAATAVALSFVVVAWFLRTQSRAGGYPRFNLLGTRIGRLLAHPVTIGLCRTLGVALFVLAITAGLIGNSNPFKNIAPTMVWVIWWVGFAYICGLIGNIWAVLNPWATLFDWAEKLAQRFRPGASLSLNLEYPRRMGKWPGVLLLLWFVWAELVWPDSDVPSNLSEAAITYSLITWLGMVCFGKQVWLRNGEAFSILFSQLARFAPTEVRVTSGAVCNDCGAIGCGQMPTNCVNCYACFERASRQDREWNLRPWAVGLLVERPVSVSLAVFVLIMLSSVTFDGILATPVWADIAEWMLLSAQLRPLILILQDITGNAIAAIGTIAMFAFVVAFQITYLLFSWLMRQTAPVESRKGWTTSEVARLFVFSLIPIALAYHLAHYLSFLLIVGQYMIPLISDPFGFGWNLFGTSLYMVNIGIVNARFIWISSVIAIVVGHIIAVYLSHVIALRAYGDNRAALRSQIPMLFLMVGYTMISLWILAQPVVETG